MIDEGSLSNSPSIATAPESAPRDGNYPQVSVTRFELIDPSGRRYTRYNVDVELSYQDDGRTLKVFVKPSARSAAEAPDSAEGVTP